MREIPQPHAINAWMKNTLRTYWQGVTTKNARSSHGDGLIAHQPSSRGKWLLKDWNCSKSTENCQCRFFSPSDHFVWSFVARIYAKWTEKVTLTSFSLFPNFSMPFRIFIFRSVIELRFALSSKFYFSLFSLHSNFQVLFFIYDAITKSV